MHQICEKSLFPSQTIHYKMLIKGGTKRWTSSLKNFVKDISALLKRTKEIEEKITKILLKSTIVEQNRILDILGGGG